MSEVLEISRVENPLLKLVQEGPLVFKSRMAKAAFDRFVLENNDLRIERDKYGTITIHHAMSYDSAINEGEAFVYLKVWGLSHKQMGDVLSPSASFNLPDGAQAKADGAWVSAEKARQLSEEERRRIPHIVPDFVMEVRSETDRISAMKKKMEETWIPNGVRLAWLIDPYKQKAWIYRADGSIDEITAFDRKLSGEAVLPGFELDLRLLKP